MSKVQNAKIYSGEYEIKIEARTGSATGDIYSEEYSSEWTPGTEPYYPVNTDRNNEILKKYEAKAKSLSNVIFGGRLGTYKYFDMDDTIINAMGDFDSFMIHYNGHYE